uniref:Uncharacterized protein n=1 Tax=Pipistrellus kuhlii TaxID=59472 RepID=A0A7J7VMJ7_PIPKU|nr:hypothetical protein mPipKuh1_008390 [Pipistrellus kuhlii]
MPPSPSLLRAIRRWLSPKMHEKSGDRETPRHSCFPSSKPANTPVCLRGVVSMMQSHPFLSLQCPRPHAGVHIGLSTIISRPLQSVHPTKDAPGGSARHCIFHSFPGPFARVLQCSLSQSGHLQLLLKERTPLTSGR